MTPTLPPRRLIAVAAALALLGGHAQAKGQTRPKSALNGAEQACPLGTFHCAPRPYNYAICRPNALLDFYDPALDRNPALRASSPTIVRSTSVDSSNQTLYHLSGDVLLQRADQKLQADTVDYNDGTTDYDAHGNVRYQAATQLIAGSHMRGNSGDGRGIADDVQYQILDARGNGVAKQGQMFDDLHTRYSMATYSTCDVGHHIWEFRAKSITLNKDTGVGTARNGTMRVGKLPFLYLPYFTFPIDNRRKSGFLTPTLGNTSRSGFEASAPYYLNLAPNYDATIDPRIYTSRGVMLATEFRYLEPGSKGQFNVQYVPNDHGDSNGLVKTRGDSRYLIDVSNTTHLWDSWNFVGSYNHASDSAYLYDYGNALSRSPIYTLASNAAIAGGGTWWNASFGGLLYQNTNPFATGAVNPYDKLPYVTLNLTVPISRWLQFGMKNEADVFRKTASVEGARVDLYPFIQADLGSSAWFARPRLAYRYTGYDLSGGYQKYGYYGVLGSATSTPFTNKSPSRALPVVSLDSGLLFDRSVSLFGSSYTQTLEPRAYYLYVPYRNQDNLPLFDSSLTSFDYYQLFTPNQFAGADRQMNANNLTGALTSRLLDENGVERVSASLGQIRYFTPQRIQIPTGANSGLAATRFAGSDYVAQFNVQLDDRWRVNTAYQWSPNTHHTDVAAFELQHRLGNDGVLNFAYHYRRALLEQYSVSAVYPLSSSWRLFSSWSYQVPIKGLQNTATGTVEALAGVQYDSCCVTLRLVDRNYVNQSYYGFGPIPKGSNLNLRANAIMFEVIFKGLGSTGGQIDPTLRRDILGYQ